MGFVEIGDEIHRMLGEYVGGIFLGGSHAWKSRGRDVDILVVLQSHVPASDWMRFVAFMKENAGKVEWGVHGPPTILNEIASFFFATARDMKNASFDDAWTARFVLLGLKPHPRNSNEMNALAERAQALAWMRLLMWLISSGMADTVDELKKVAEGDVIGSRSFTAGIRWSVKMRGDKVFLRHLAAKIQAGIDALVNEKKITIADGRISPCFADASPPFRKNISPTIKRPDFVI